MFRPAASSLAYFKYFILFEFIVCLNMNKFYLHFTIDSIYLFNIIYNIFKFVALIFPNFSTLLSLSGCICSVSLGFVIPFILYYYTFWNNIQIPEKIFRQFFLFIAVVVGIVGIVFNFIKI